MYLEIKEGSSSKQYTLTDSYAKPYIKVSNQSVLPLTTNTTQGLQLKVSIGGSTMRGMEFNTMSTSVTYYSSAANPGIMSSTTALTRQSTSSTSYLTRPSTSGESYITRPSTSGTSYLTAKGNWFYGQSMTWTSYSGHWVYNNGTPLDTRYSMSQYKTFEYEIPPTTDLVTDPIYQEGYYESYNYYYGTVSNMALARRIAQSLQQPITWSVSYIQTNYRYFVRTAEYHWNTYSESFEEVTTSSTSMTTYQISGRNLYDVRDSNTYDTDYYRWAGGTYQTGYVSSILNSRLTSYTTYSDYHRMTADPAWYRQISQYYYWDDGGLNANNNSGFSRTTIEKFSVKVSTTGTQFLTRASTYSTSYLTRPSTSQTSYLTRPSTSGYTGVSSSSSSSQGWQ